MKLCPWKFTERFHERIREMFFVANFSRCFDLIKRQFLSGKAVHLGGDRYRIHIKDCPAVVVVSNATLITVYYDN
jgi:hypothetical protein